MRKKIVILAAIFVTLISSCQKEIFTVEDQWGTFADENGKEAVLGKKLENPYAVKNMKKAIQLLMSVAPGASYPDMNNIEPTHYYVRFLPKDTTELVVLDNDTTLVLNTVPFGYENRLELDEYHDPSIPADQITWLYAVVPVQQTLPDIHHEIIEEIYAPEENEDELELLALKLTNNLPAETINGKEIMSADLTNHEVLAIFSRRYNPSGHVFVENINDSGQVIGELPVRNAAIEVQTLWWDDVVHTDHNGYYFVPRRYKDITSIRLWNKNRLSYITKTWTEHTGLWVRDKIGSGKANTRTVIAQRTEDRWYKATVNNAFQDYDRFAAANGIPRPNYVRTYVLSGMSTSGAPMLNSGPLTRYSSYFAGIANQAGQASFWRQIRNVGIGIGTEIVDNRSLITGQMSNYPDIVIGIKSGRTSPKFKSTHSVYGNVLHELAHYSHRKKVGDRYWASVQYQAMFDPTNNLGVYGDGSAHYAKYTAVAEAWSHFVEYDQMSKLHQQNSATGQAVSAYRVDDNRTVAYQVGHTHNAKWIPAGLFRDLMDTDQNIIELRNNNDNFLLEGIDRVAGFTYHQLFELLTDDITSIPLLRDKIIRRYPAKNVNNEVRNLFQYFGY